ncbi:C1 family peptidase [Methylobacterium segetis]|uniref:C1 family peptidase n=1 Tax=Methylobacterium segetis TaxID=2488750 RepID=UPI0010500BF8|nr:C1 family peptidase [Methylobacterium segetis]
MAGRKQKAPARRLDALPDTVDFRDALYVPALIAVSAISDIEGYRRAAIPVLDQGREGACTGYGLATVANYLLQARGKDPSADEVSAWMLYTMAKRYDEWPGEDYEGSSARGAMKGWHKHGLCAKALWQDADPNRTLTEARSADALRRPLGAYFRVNHKDLVAMHAAIGEVGILYATASVHEGWQQVGTGDERIAYRPGAVPIGGHAFAIVGYNREGFWIQNSWGRDWGADGLALVTYADWLANGTDVWVAALGAPIELAEDAGPAAMLSGAPRSYESRIYADLRPHIITAKNDGILDDKGAYGLTEAGLKDIVAERMPRRMAGWARKRVVLYAHGGLVSEEAAVQTVAGNLDPLLKAEVYPLSFIWRSDALSTIGNILRDALGRRRSEGILDAAKDFMLDRIDDTLEPLARLLGGKALWDEMKENATRATTRAKGAARLTAAHLADLSKSGAIDEIHLVGHSAGAVFHAHLASHLAAESVPVRSLTLWAPACTMALFDAVYRPLIDARRIESFDLYTLDDATEQDDDCAGLYNKSLLYLVRAAFEERAGIFGGTPLLGLERDARSIPASFWRPKRTAWHLAPGPDSKALHHGDFDNDPATLLSTLRRITEQPQPVAVVEAARAGRTRSRAANRQIRRRLDLVPAR